MLAPRAGHVARGGECPEDVEPVGPELPHRRVIEDERLLEIEEMDVVPVLREAAAVIAANGATADYGDAG